MELFKWVLTFSINLFLGGFLFIILIALILTNYKNKNQAMLITNNINIQTFQKYNNFVKNLWRMNSMKFQYFFIQL